MEGGDRRSRQRPTGQAPHRPTQSPGQQRHLSATRTRLSALCQTALGMEASRSGRGDMQPSCNALTFSYGIYCSIWNLLLCQLRRKCGLEKAVMQWAAVQSQFWEPRFKSSSSKPSFSVVSSVGGVLSSSFLVRSRLWEQWGSGDFLK